MAGIEKTTEELVAAYEAAKAESAAFTQTNGRLNDHLLAKMTGAQRAKNVALGQDKDFRTRQIAEAKDARDSLRRRVLNSKGLDSDAAAQLIFAQDRLDELQSGKAA